MPQGCGYKKRMNEYALRPVHAPIIVNFRFSWLFIVAGRMMGASYTLFILITPFNRTMIIGVSPFASFVNSDSTIQYSILTDFLLSSACAFQRRLQEYSTFQVEGRKLTDLFRLKTFRLWQTLRFFYFRILPFWRSFSSSLHSVVPTVFFRGSLLREI